MKKYVANKEHYLHKEAEEFLKEYKELKKRETKLILLAVIANGVLFFLINLFAMMGWEKLSVITAFLLVIFIVPSFIPGAICVQSGHIKRFNDLKLRKAIIKKKVNNGKH